MDENKVYPVLYYDLGNIDLETLRHLYGQIEDFFDRENVPFILLPRDINLKYLTKEEALKELERLKEYVESWE